MRPAGFTVIELLLVMAILGTLTALGIPKLQSTINQARIARAIGDIRTLETDIDGQEHLPVSLAEIGRGGMRDPWGRPYVYTPLAGHGAGGARKDRFLVPLNSSYDLYSVGKDGVSALPLTAAQSRDDIVRANDGAFIGLASKF
jgi:general secretion pathway protein G